METPASAEIPTNTSGLWVGQLVIANNGPTTPLEWVLTFLPSYGYPTSFGSSRLATHALHGEFKVETKSFELHEVCVETNEEVAQYRGAVTRSADGSLCIKGDAIVMDEMHQKHTGVFACRHEDVDPNVHLTGLWGGDARPDVSLSDFFIPNNPIQWSCAVLKSRNSINGAGYFNDSGDIPNQPVLFFVVRGTVDSATGKATFKKIYQKCPQTDGYVVEYEGTLVQPEAGGKWALTGTWKNPKGGSFGDFSCTLDIQ